MALTPTSRSLRCALGPTAWAVLEEVALDASGDGNDRLVASTNVRRVAANVGIGKDTAARALGRLCQVGLLAPIRQEHGEGGRFLSAGYQLRPAAAELFSGPCPASPDTAVPPAPRPQGPNTAEPLRSRPAEALTAGPPSTMAAPRRRSRRLVADRTAAEARNVDSDQLSLDLLAPNTAPTPNQHSSTTAPSPHTSHPT